MAQDEGGRVAADERFAALEARLAALRASFADPSSPPPTRPATGSQSSPPVAGTEPSSSTVAPHRSPGPASGPAAGPAAGPSSASTHPAAAEARPVLTVVRDLPRPSGPVAAPSDPSAPAAPPATASATVPAPASAAAPAPATASAPVPVIATTVAVTPSVAAAAPVTEPLVPRAPGALVKPSVPSARVEPPAVGGRVGVAPVAPPRPISPARRPETPSVDATSVASTDAMVEDAPSTDARDDAVRTIRLRDVAAAAVTAFVVLVLGGLGVVSAVTQLAPTLVRDASLAPSLRVGDVALVTTTARPGDLVVVPRASGTAVGTLVREADGRTVAVVTDGTRVAVPDGAALAGVRAVVPVVGLPVVWAGRLPRDVTAWFGLVGVGAALGVAVGATSRLVAAARRPGSADVRARSWSWTVARLRRTIEGAVVDRAGTVAASRARSTVGVLGAAIVALAVLLPTGVALGGTGTLVVVRDGSMVPVLRPGDVVRVTPTPGTSVGDVIALAGPTGVAGVAGFGRVLEVAGTELTIGRNGSDGATTTSVVAEDAVAGTVRAIVPLVGAPIALVGGGGAARYALLPTLALAAALVAAGDLVVATARARRRAAVSASA